MAAGCVALAVLVLGGPTSDAAGDSDAEPNTGLVLQVAADDGGDPQVTREPLSLTLPSQLTPEVYRSLLRDYVDRPKETVATVLGWRAREVATIAQMTGAAHAELSRAIVTLHTDVALTLITHDQPADAHLEVARRELERTLKGTEFERDWLLARGAELQLAGRIREALGYYTKCLRKFPNAAAAWMAAGAVREADAFPQGHGPGRLVQPGSRAAADAERDYRRAIEIDPTLDEAHVRLGRVLLGTERNGEALAELQRVARQEPGGRMTAMARLLLGDALEQVGRTEEGLGQYRAALDADPTLQPAAAAVGEILRRRNDEPGAIEALRASLGHARATEAGTWSTYRMGWGAHAPALLESLRSQAHAAAVALAEPATESAP